MTVLIILWVFSQASLLLICTKVLTLEYSQVKLRFKVLGTTPPHPHKSFKINLEQSPIHTKLVLGEQGLAGNHRSNRNMTSGIFITNLTVELTIIRYRCTIFLENMAVKNLFRSGLIPKESLVVDQMSVAISKLPFVIGFVQFQG